MNKLGESFTLERGAFLFMPRGISHSLQMASEPPIRILEIASPSGFEHFMEDVTEAFAAGYDRSSAEVAAVQAKHEWEPLF